MIQFIIIFAIVFATDICWTFYLLKVHERKSLQAGVWAGVIYLLASLAVTSYVENKWLIIPAVIASVLGTFVSIEWKKYRERQK